MLCDLEQVAQLLGTSAVPPVRRAVLAGRPLYADGDSDAGNHTPRHLSGTWPLH